MERNQKISLTLSRTDFPIGEPADDGLIHRSGRKGVVAKVHALCEKLITQQGKSRKDVIAAATKLGIARNTAATQHDWWKNPPKKKVKAKKAVAKAPAKPKAKAKKK